MRGSELLVCMNKEAMRDYNVLDEGAHGVPARVPQGKCKVDLHTLYSSHVLDSPTLQRRSNLMDPSHKRHNSTFTCTLYITIT